MTQIALREKELVSRPLKILVPLIKEEIEHGREAADQAAKPFFQRAGDLLLEAKPQMDHGEWEGWVKRNFTIGSSTARRWMQYAKELPGYQNARGPGVLNKPPSIEEIVSPNRDYSNEPSRSWREPVREHLNERVTPTFVDRFAQERQDREKEQQLMRKLANELIDIGYKVLATKLHPDKGGSQEAMSRLNKVKSLLKQAI